MKRLTNPAALPVTPVDTADADTAQGPNSVSVDSVSSVSTGDAIFGEPIHAYTRADALADGVLVDVTEQATAGMLGGFAVPVAVTAGVSAAVEAIPDSLDGLADARGRLHDVLWMACLAVRRHVRAKFPRDLCNSASWHLRPSGGPDPSQVPQLPKAPRCQVAHVPGELAPSIAARFEVILPCRGTRKRVQTLCAVVGPDDDGRPCVTIGYPEDF